MTTTSLHQEMRPKAAYKINQDNARLHQWREVLNLLRLNRQNRLVRRLARKQQNGTIGVQTVEPEDDEDDYVHFGDTVINYGPTQQQPKVDSAPEPPPVQSEPEWPPASEIPTIPPASSSPLWPIILATALGAGGLGVGLTSWFTRAQTPSIVDTDTDTQYQLDFAGEKERVNATH